MPRPKLIDTHAHLDADIYGRDLDIVVKHALAEGVWIVTVGNDYRSSKRAVELAERYPEGVYAAVGVHPLRVPTDITAEGKLLELEKFAELAAHPKVVALGETGLDFHDLPEDPRTDPHLQLAERIRENQRTVFGKFLELSRETRLPLLVHCRDAHEEMLDMLETWDKASVGFDWRGVVHCFSGSWREAKKYYNLNFAISFTGILAHGGYQSDILKRSPSTQVVIESDCPYLTPVPWSIRRNEPSYIAHLAEIIAGIRGERPDALAAQTTENALRIFTRIPS